MISPKQKVYHSFLEFQKEFYPSQFEPQQQLMKIDDPGEFGTRLAQLSLMKLKQSLEKYYD